MNRNGEQPRLAECRWIEFPTVMDQRGALTPVESRKTIPFTIERVFYLHDIEADRGGHAHRDTDQVIIAASGKFTITARTVTETATFAASRPTHGLYVPRGIFVAMTDFSPGAVCLVLASTHYDMARSIRSWEDYTAEMGQAMMQGAPNAP